MSEGNPEGIGPGAENEELGRHNSSSEVSNEQRAFVAPSMPSDEEKAAIKANWEAILKSPTKSQGPEHQPRIEEDPQEYFRPKSRGFLGSLWSYLTRPFRGVTPPAK